MAEADELIASDPAAAALNAIYAAMELSHQIRAKFGALLELASALEDRREGRLVEWLQPVNVGGTNRLRRAERYLRALALATLQRLADEGLPVKEAATRVAAALQVGGRDISPTVLLQWRARQHQYFAPEHFRPLLAQVRRLPVSDALAELVKAFRRA